MSNTEAEKIAARIEKNFTLAQTLSESEVRTLISKVRYILKKQSLCKKIKTGKVLAVGDIHGDFTILQKVLTIFKKEKPLEHIIFLGDIVDRGSQSMACLNLIFAMLILYPNRVHFIRGNHEAITVNSRYGFSDEVQLFGGEEDLYNHYNSLFSELPIALVHEEQKIFYVHGGIPINPCSLTDFEKLPRKDVYLDNPTIKQFLWNDPKDDLLQYNYSMRGEGIYNYGLELVEAFLLENNLKMIVRAHEAFSNGFKYFFDGKVLSIFTSEEYYEYIQAKVAIIDVDRTIQIFHPNEYKTAILR